MTQECVNFTTFISTASVETKVSWRGNRKYYFKPTSFRNVSAKNIKTMIDQVMREF